MENITSPHVVPDFFLSVKQMALLGRVANHLQTDALSLPQSEHQMKTNHMTCCKLFLKCAQLLHSLHLHAWLPETEQDA